MEGVFDPTVLDPCPSLTGTCSAPTLFNRTDRTYPRLLLSFQKSKPTLIHGFFKQKRKSLPAWSRSKNLLVFGAYEGVGGPLLITVLDAKSKISARF